MTYTKPLILLLLLLGLHMVTRSQVDLSSNLVICMPMNGNAQDMSGNNNHGTVHAATLTTDRLGNANSAYKFDGSSSYIQVAGSHSLDSIELKNQITITLWANVTDWYQSWNVFSFVDKYRTSDDGGWAYELQNPGASGFGMLFVINYALLATASNTIASAFHHWDFYAVTYSMASGTCNFYKNGVQVSSTVGASVSLENTLNGPLYIGFSPTGPDEYSNGEMDELMVYSRVLNAAEILAIYNNGSVCGCVPLSVNNSTICAGNSAVLNVTGGTAPSYTWSTGAVNTASIQVNPTTTTSYTVKSVCGTPATAQVMVIDSTQAKISCNLSDSCHGNVVFQSLDHSVYNTWSLSNGQMAHDTSVFSTHVAPGEYQMTYVTYPGSACADTTNLSFSMHAGTAAGPVPNVITPNNDGVNDRFDFKPYTYCGEFDLKIFDRWGLLIMHSAESTKTSWDGRNMSGELVSDGVYYYVLETSRETLRGALTVFK